MTVILCLAAVLGTMAAFFYYWKSKTICRRLDEVLDDILSGRTISQSALKEGELSQLVCKAKRVQEKSEFEIRGANEEKEQVKSLISDMSHQLKTPLSSIIMFQEILQGQEITEKERKVIEDKLKNQTSRLEWILNSLFKMTKLEQGAIEFQLEECYIKDTILDAVNSVFTKACQKKIQITMEEFEDYKLLHNKKWTVEVFVNLLENAIKYTDLGGRIEISVSPFMMYSRIGFKDSGIGIRQEEKLKIFQRFYRGREVEHIEGSGIGLYLSKLILENEKGYLTVESDNQRGSCFYVHLRNVK